MASNTVNIHRLQQALNSRGCKILYSTSQFYSDEAGRPITVYHIKTVTFDEKKQKNMVVELYKSTSQIRIVLYLRDLWYELNGMPIPQDNPMWNNKKYDTSLQNYVEE